MRWQPVSAIGVLIDYLKFALDTLQVTFWGIVLPIIISIALTEANTTKHADRLYRVGRWWADR